MIKNYFKSAWRNLTRNKVYSFINVAGLSLGLACAMLIMLYVKDEVSFDRFHKNVDNIYRVVSQRKENKIPVTGLLQGPRFTQNVPGIKSFVRVDSRYEDIKTGTAIQSQSVLHVDSNFFSVFTFPLLSGAFNGLDWPGKTPDQDFYITATNVQYDWIKTAGFKLAEGRDFSRNYGTDTAACLINEAAAKRMGLKEPITGTKLGDNTVIGVVQDFAYNQPFSSPQPMIIYFGRNNRKHIFVRIANNEKWRENVAQIERTIKRLNPGFPFEFRFTKEEYQKNFKEFVSLKQMANVFGGMAIFISCLGLFGLSAFLAERRGKEISIRKILGARASSLWFTLSKDFLKPVFIAFLIAAPISGLVMQKVLQQMDYHIQLSWWIFIVAALASVIIAVITVSYNSIKAAIANPVKSLRSE